MPEDKCTNRAVLDLARLGRRSGGACSRCSGPSKRDERAETFEKRWPDSLHPTKACQVAEGAERVAVGDDAMGERWPDARQGFDLAHRGTIEIDWLAARRPHPACRLATGAWGPGARV